MSRLTQEQFLRDVAQHEMTVLHESGVYRHVRFGKPGTICMSFNLITYPGHLVYSGDMGNFVFERLHDMFEFFRKEPGTDLDRYIDRRYWAEKIEASDRDGVEEFSDELFQYHVLRDLKQWLRGHRDETTKEERRELWEAVMDEVLGADGDSGGHRKQVAANDFHHKIRKGLEFWFQDFWDHRVTDYTPRFQWACLAIAWGIWQYDAAKSAQQPTTGGACA